MNFFWNSEMNPLLLIDWMGGFGISEVLRWVIAGWFCFLKS